METAHHLDQGRRAIERCAWSEAYRHLAAVDESGQLTPEDLERLATAAYLTGHDAPSTDAFTRAHRRWLERGDLQRAIRCRFWLGFGLVQRGDMSQGGGWLARIASRVEHHHLDSVERGYLLVPEALRAMGDGDSDAALERSEQVAVIARRFGDADLAGLASIGRGEALLRLGRINEGVRLLDEAMASVTAGETSSVISGLVYCAVIDACHQVFDLRRAREWTLALDRWCEGQPGLVPYRGQCLVHRSQVHQLRGEWRAAAAEAVQARAYRADPPHPAIGMAYYQLGELHRLRGDLPAAEHAYRQAHLHDRNPQPGLALLRLAKGRADAAAAAIEAALREVDDQLSRGQLLPAHVEIVLATGRTELAEATADELDRLAQGTAATLLHTIAAQARGAVVLAAGEPEAALGPLGEALQGLQAVAAPYETAQVRMLVAATCRALDDHDRAELECDGARRVFEEVGAEPAVAQLDALVAGGSRDLPVTGREAKVLAAGDYRADQPRGGRGGRRARRRRTGRAGTGGGRAVPTLRRRRCHGDGARRASGHRARGTRPVTTTERAVARLDDLVDQACDDAPVLVAHLVGGAVAAGRESGHRSPTQPDRSAGARGLVQPGALRSHRARRAGPGRLTGPTPAAARPTFAEPVHPQPGEQRAHLGDNEVHVIADNLVLVRSDPARRTVRLLREAGDPRIPRVELERIAVAVHPIRGRHHRAHPLRIAERARHHHTWTLHVVHRVGRVGTPQRPDAILVARRAAPG